MKTKHRRKTTAKKKKNRVILEVPTRPALSSLDKKQLQERIVDLEGMLKEVIDERDIIYKEYCWDHEDFVRMRITKEEMDYLEKHGVRGEEMLAEVDEVMASAAK